MRYSFAALPSSDHFSSEVSPSLLRAAFFMPLIGTFDFRDQMG